MITLLGGAVLAMLTSVGVRRGIVRAQRSVWSDRELLRVTLASIGNAMVTTMQTDTWHTSTVSRKG